MSTRHLLFVAGLVLTAAPTAFAQVETGPAQDLGAAVRTILHDKCVSCHEPGSDNRKAKRELDRAWDLHAVIDAWGDPLAPDLAPLWEVLDDGSMPPEDSEVAPLTEVERQAAFAWLEAGMPLPKDGNPFADLELAAKYLQPREGSPPPATVPPLQGWARFARWAGRQHAASTHFPVAFLFLLGLLRLAAWCRRRPPYLLQEQFCLVVGALGALLAAGLGWWNASHSGAGGEELFYHRWIGVSLTALACLLWAWRGSRTGRLYGSLLIVLMLLVAAGGHLGGELVFGEAYLAY